MTPLFICSLTFQTNSHQRFLSNYSSELLEILSHSFFRHAIWYDLGFFLQNKHQPPVKMMTLPLCIFTLEPGITRGYHRYLVSFYGILS